MGEYKVGLPPLTKGVEASLHPDLFEKWQSLRARMMSEASLHPTIPDYIYWPQFNRPPHHSLEVENRMGEVLAGVFAPFKPTIVLGIMNSGERLARNLSGRFEDPPLMIPCLKTENPTSLREGPVVHGMSYTIGECWFSLPNIKPGNRVLVVDDTAARGGASMPILEGITAQPGLEVAFCVGFDKQFQGWSHLLNERFPQVPAFSVVRVSGIDHNAKKIKLMDERQALKII